MPKIDRDAAQRYERQAYPGRLRKRTDGCWKIRLSDAGGLTQFGAGEVTLSPGASTGLYHWHENEDEFVYVLEGEVVMIEGGEELTLGPGDSATFKAGARVGHTFENRSNAPARLLEVGTRSPAGETAYYPGLDLVYRRNGTEIRFEGRDGGLYAETDDPPRLADDPENAKPASPLDIE
ncbi:MAG: cupin domain-containing protein [Parvularculaceae bacterium]